MSLRHTKLQKWDLTFVRTIKECLYSYHWIIILLKCSDTWWQPLGWECHDWSVPIYAFSLWIQDIIFFPFYNCRVACLMNYIIQLPVSLMVSMKVCTYAGHFYSPFFIAASRHVCKFGLKYKLGFFLETSAGIAIGGDVFPGSTLSDHVLRFNNIPQVY